MACCSLNKPFNFPIATKFFNGNVHTILCNVHEGTITSVIQTKKLDTCGINQNNPVITKGKQLRLMNLSGQSEMLQ